jgi:TRAP-type mannitol/chloroaromatic compound transport system permease small subunit
VRKIVRVIDSISDRTGRTACWLASILVFLVALEVIMRYVFNAPTMWNYETSQMTGGSLFALGWAYAHRYHSHVRIDVLYTRLSPRAKAGVDVFGTFFLFFPLMLMFISTSIAWTWQAWEINEKSVETYWYPPIAPFRTVVTIGLILFTLQGLAQFIRDFYLLVRNKTYG